MSPLVSLCPLKDNKNCIMHLPRFSIRFNWIIGLLGYWVIGLFLPSPAHAQVAGGCGDVATIGCLEQIFSNVVKSMVSLAIVALFIMIIVGGYKFIFSGGDAKQVEGAKGTLTGAILGMVVIVSAYLILRLIGNISGANVTEFTIPTN